MIITRGLRLRLACPDDAGMVLELMRDPDVARWNPAAVDDESAAARWCRDLADWSAGDHASWIVADLRDDAPLGVVSVHAVDLVQADAEIGYRVHPSARGRGVATEAVVAASAWAFAHLGLVRIELAHAVGNVASCRVAERAGYRLEGVTRQSFVYGDGCRHDEHLHGRLVGDRLPAAVRPPA